MLAERRIYQIVVASGLIGVAFGVYSVASAGDPDAAQHSPKGTPGAFATHLDRPIEGLSMQEAIDRVTGEGAGLTLVSKVSVSADATTGPPALEIHVQSSGDDHNTRARWEAALAQGAIAELARTDASQESNRDVIDVADVVLDTKSGPVTLTGGSGSVRLGQIFGAESAAMTDEDLIAHVDEALSGYQLRSLETTVVHPLGAALVVVVEVPDGAAVTWTLNELERSLVGKDPLVEGLFVELRDSHGSSLVRHGIAYRPSASTMSFAKGQDQRFGVIHLS